MKLLKKIVISPGWWLMLLALPAVWALLVPGFFGASDDLHIAWLYELDRVIQSGVFPPRFVPDLSFGFGYPLFHFVYPLPYYLGEIFHLVGFSLVDSVKLVMGLSLVLSGYLMYRWMREYLPGWWAMLAGLIYIYTPYRSTDVYVRGAIGETLAFVWLPLIGWAISRIVAKPSWRWVGIGGLAVGGLVLTHNITAYMTLPFLLGLAVMLVWFKGQRRWWIGLKLAAMVLLGLVISSYFWLPAIIDSSQVTGSTDFTYADHFPTLVQLIKPYWGYGASVPGPYDGMSFFMGYVNILVILGGLGLSTFYWRRFSSEERILLVWGYLSLGVAIVMMNFRSIWLWEHLPLIKYFQFPWRWLIIETLTVPVLLISWKRLRPEVVWVGGMVLVTILSVGSWFRPHDFLGRTDSYYLDRYIPVPIASTNYHLAGEEYGTLPLSVKQRPTQKMILAEASPAADIVITPITALATKLTIKAPMATTVSFNKYFWPGWQASVDGQAVAVRPGLPYGQIVFEVPAGQHQVMVSYQETPGWRLLDGVSLGGLVLAVGLSCFWRKSKK